MIFPALVFVETQKEFMRKGYSETMAFQLAEKAHANILSKNRLDAKILTDYARTNASRSFYSYAGQQAVYFYIEGDDTAYRSLRRGRRRCGC